jgi:hypothetical protein
MRNRNVEAYRKAHPPKAATSRQLEQRLRAEAAKAGRSVEAHFQELEEDICAAAKVADAKEEYATKMAQKRRLEELRGKRL